MNALLMSTVIHNTAVLLVLTLFASPSGKPQIQERQIVISHDVYFRHPWLFKEYTWHPSKETQGKSTEGRIWRHSTPTQ